MSDLCFTLAVCGGVLDFVGAISGLLRIIGGKVFNYKYINVLSWALPRFVPIEQTIGNPGYALMQPFYASEELAISREPNEHFNVKYVSCRLVLTLLVVCTFFISISIYLLLLNVALLIAGKIDIPIWSLALWGVSIVSLNIFSMAFQLALLLSSPHNPLTSIEKIGSWTISRFFKNLFVTPLYSLIMSVVLILLIMLHWFAWITYFLPVKYQITLDNELVRQKYYGIYSYSNLVIGSSLILTSIILNH